MDIQKRIKPFIYMQIRKLLWSLILKFRPYPTRIYIIHNYSISKHEIKSITYPAFLIQCSCSSFKVYVYSYTDTYTHKHYYEGLYNVHFIL